MDSAGDRILVVDEARNMRTVLHRVLGHEGYHVECAASAEQALTQLATESFDLVISELRLPDMDGVELIQRAKSAHPAPSYILLTTFGQFEPAVPGMKVGFVRYLTKPVDDEDLKQLVRKSLEAHRLTGNARRLPRQDEVHREEFADIIGKSGPMQGIFRQVKQVAGSDSTVLLQGESGTGKELFARAIHQHSARRDAPYVAVDCGAVPEALLESELFGHVKGAFTGAVLRRGLFEEAEGGTLFLDEINNIGWGVQAKLLRALQEKEIRLLGSNKTFTVDVRIIASTSADLVRAVRERTFREELYYRLAVIPLTLPPLRERREDIPLLVEHFIRKTCERNQLGPKQISADTLELLMNAPWAGNVRELENVIERVVVLSQGPELRMATFAPSGLEETTAKAWQAGCSPEPLRQATKQAQETLERERIAEALDRSHGVRSRAAALLGISRSTFYTKLRQYHFDHPGEPAE